MARNPVINYHDSFLYQAATSQSSEEISVTQTLLSTPQVFSQAALNNTLLYASENKSSNLVKALLTAGAYIESRDETGRTPLLLSVGSSRVNITRLLLTRGANVNACDNNGDTPLILSTYSSASHDTTKLLLEAENIALDHRNVNGFTALACAIQAVNLEAIKLLIDANVGSITFAFAMPTAVAEASRNNGIFNLIELFKLQKDTGKQAILQAATKRDSMSINYITSMDNTVLNYDSSIYLRSVIEILRTIHASAISDNEMNIIRILIDMYLSLRKGYTDKLLEDQAMKMALSVGQPPIISLLCKSKFFVSNEVLGSLATRGQCNLLNIMIRNGANVCEVSSGGQQLYAGSALDKAIQNEQFECAKILLCSGAFMDLPLALKLAVETRNEKCLRFLLKECPESRLILNSSSLLHLAVAESDLIISKILLDNGADVNGLHENKIPLMEVTDIKSLDFLVSRGADVNMVIGNNVSFRLVLHYFISIQYKSYLKTKSTVKGMDTLSIRDLHAALIKRLIFYGATVDGLDSMDRTPLMVASESGDSSEAIKVLVNAGANINMSRDDDSTALHVAVQHGEEENAKCLLELGADINAGAYVWNSVLFLCDEVDLLQLLLDRKADANAVDNEGDNAIMLHLKQWSGGTEIIRALIEAKCDVNHQNQDGKTPLLLAINHLEPEILSLLLRSGADVNYAITKNGKNKCAVSTIIKRLWHQRSRAGQCLHVLVDHGLNIQNISPYIIHALIAVGCFSIVTKLIALGLPPVEMIVQRTITAWYKTECTISPLVAALLLDNVQAAQHFVNIRYLTRKDLRLFLCENKDAKNYFQSQRKQSCVEFLDKISNQPPMSLETLSLIAASEVFGSGPGRKDAIEKSGLPVPLQELISHKNTSFNIEDSNGRKMFLYKSALRNANICSFDDRYLEMMDEYDSDFDSDSD